jgi:hypothetical protein
VNISARLSTSDRSIILLAPSYRRARQTFRRTYSSQFLYARFKSEMQRLRGSIYLNDGAITPSDLAPDGRHVMPHDTGSWHLLSIDSTGSVVGCARYLEHPNGTTFNDLRIRHSALASCSQWGSALRGAVEKELATASRLGFSYCEFGGWAMAPQIRGTAECLRHALSSYAWSRLIGGAIGISTATERNGSASILQRLGGRSLEWGGSSIPPYFDGKYGCQMRMLRFDSRFPNPRYEDAIQELLATLSDIPVICGEEIVQQVPKPDFRAVPEPMRAHLNSLAAAV